MANLLISLNECYVGVVLDKDQTDLLAVLVKGCQTKEEMKQGCLEVCRHEDK